MPETESRWKTSSGLPLDGKDAVCVAFSFCYNAAIPPGDSVFARFLFKLDETSEIVDQHYSVGKDWEPADNGTRLMNVKAGGDPNRFINDSANFGVFINKVIELGVVDSLGGDPLTPEPWIGFHAHFEKFLVPGRKNPTTGVANENAFVLVPTRYLGRVTVDGVADSVVGAKAAASRTKPAGKAAARDLTPDILTKLNELARTLDYDNFVQSAFEVPGVAGNPVAEELVMNVDKLYDIARAAPEATDAPADE